jgi:RHS repeat-associated protein
MGLDGGRGYEVHGQIRDSETGMDFFPKRYYASAVGRFTSPDPMNLGADLLDPQSWNAYAYVRNNPLALVDPMGLCTFDADHGYLIGHGH